MSENERMDRARRIQELREGRRGEDSTAENGEGSESADGAAVAAVESAAELDDEVAAAVERVTGSSAEIPDPEEMGASTEPTETEPTAVDQAEAAAEDTEEVAGPAGVGRATQPTEEKTRVLEFMLGDERYCLDIEYIEEIVKDTTITRVPNTPEFVEGVVDLRGQITTILNPKVRLEAGDTDPGELLVVFDSEAFEEQGYLGWVVDDVRQVSPVAEAEVNDPPFEDEHVNGVIDREDDEDFVVWTSPEMALDEAA